MLLTTADLIRSAHAKASRFPMTFAAPRFTSETPTSARRSSIQMACFPSTTAVFARHKKEKKSAKIVAGLQTLIIDEYRGILIDTPIPSIK
jgi:hypothetical protein